LNTPNLKISNNTAYTVNTDSLTRIVKITGVDEKDVLQNSISVSLIDEDAMRKLNKRFFGRNKSTDVLTFTNEFSEAEMLGEIVINLDYISGQEEIDTYLERTFLHGLLHLLGYDHINSKEAIAMREKEQLYQEKIDKSKV
jgi:probable rRNA maturation factor